MRQLSLFGRAEITAMRDPTMSRNYSPAGEAFRREHARHRAHGLRRRHAEKLARIRQTRAEQGPAPATDSQLQPTQRTSPPTPVRPPTSAADRPGHHLGPTGPTCAVNPPRHPRPARQISTANPPRHPRPAGQISTSDLPVTLAQHGGSARHPAQSPSATGLDRYRRAACPPSTSTLDRRRRAAVSRTGSLEHLSQDLLGELATTLRHALAALPRRNRRRRAARGPRPRGRSVTPRSAGSAGLPGCPGHSCRRRRLGYDDTATSTRRRSASASVRRPATQSDVASPAFGGSPHRKVASQAAFVRPIPR
jgi:hypothetical protein